MTLISRAEQDRTLGLPQTSSPALRNGWVAAELVAIWVADGLVRVSGVVVHGLPGTAAFVLEEAQRPAADLTFGDLMEVTVSTGGEVVAHGGPAPQAVEAAFSARGGPDDREPLPT